MDLDGLIGFCELLLQFGEIDRRLLLPSARDENDAEHSYTLAMTAWYIANRAGAELDVSKVIKYALAHDLIETYAGDTFVFDRQRAADKAEREHVAAEILQRNYPDFGELHELIKRYERRADAEARFVYALDKLLPVIIIYISKGLSWQRDKISLEMLAAEKRDKMAESPLIAKLWDELVPLLEQHPEMFPAADTAQPVKR